MLQGDADTAVMARRLRAATTLPEGLLWQRLRLRPGGLKFRRQHPAGRYVADFYCHQARLIVEVDGVSHDMGDRPLRDELRDLHFRERGLRVLRLLAKDVLRDPDEAASTVVAYALGEA